MVIGADMTNVEVQREKRYSWESIGHAGPQVGLAIQAKSTMAVGV